MAIVCLIDSVVAVALLDGKIVLECKLLGDH